MHPHTLHFHGVRKTWMNDGVPTTTGITVNGRSAPYTLHPEMGSPVASTRAIRSASTSSTRGS